LVLEQTLAQKCRWGPSFQRHVLKLLMAVLMSVMAIGVGALENTPPQWLLACWRQCCVLYRFWLH
jgi:hypothetical protein